MTKTPSQALPHDGGGASAQGSAGNTTGTYRYQANRQVLSDLLDHIKNFEQRVVTSQAMRKHVEKQVSIAFGAGAPTREYEYLANQYEAETKHFVDVVWDSLLHEIRSRLTTDVVMTLITSTRGGTES